MCLGIKPIYNSIILSIKCSASILSLQHFSKSISIGKYLHLLFSGSKIYYKWSVKLLKLLVLRLLFLFYSQGGVGIEEHYKSMAKQRYVNTRFWSDNFISELNPLDRYLFLYFLTNEHTNICGIYEVPLKTISFETGLELDMLKKMLNRLKGKVFYINGWVYIKNFAKHQAVNESIKKGIDVEKSRIPQNILSEIEKTDPDVYDRLDTRRNAMKSFAKTSGKIALASIPFAIGSMFQKAYSSPASPTDIIIDTLNFALTLEYLESNFYIKAVASGIIPAGDALNSLTTIRDHENEHVNFLKTAITAAGATPVSFTASTVK